MGKRILVIFFAAMMLVLVLGVGAVAGGALVYFAMQTKPVQALAAAQVAPDRDEGLLVASVEPDSPAAQAGLVRGDILLELNGEAVSNDFNLFELLADLNAGDQVTLSVLHGDEQRSLTATLGDRNGQAYLGIEPCSCNLQDGTFFFPAYRQGILITEVVANSPAAQAGLKKGDRIVAVDGQEINHANDLRELLAQHQPGDQLKLMIERAEEEASEVSVTLGEDPENSEKAYLGIRYSPGLVFPGLENEPAPFEGRLPFEMPDIPEGIIAAAIVSEVLPDSPAAQAGLQAGDLITAIDGQSLENPGGLAQAVAAHKPGDSIELTVYNSGNSEPAILNATLGENPEQAGKAYLGIRYGEVIIRRNEQNSNDKQNIPDTFFKLPPLKNLIPGGVDA